MRIDRIYLNKYFIKNVDGYILASATILHSLIIIGIIWFH